MKFVVFAYVKDTLGLLDIFIKGCNVKSKNVENIDVTNNQANVTLVTSNNDNDLKEKLEMIFTGCSLENAISITQDAEEIGVKVKCNDHVVKLFDNEIDYIGIEEKMKNMGNIMIKKPFACRCFKCDQNILSSKDFKDVQPFRTSAVDLVENVWCFCGCSQKSHANSYCNHCDLNKLVEDIKLEQNLKSQKLEKCFILDTKVLFYSEKSSNIITDCVSIDNEKKITCSKCGEHLGIITENLGNDKHPLKYKIDFKSLKVVTSEEELSVWSKNENDLELAISSEIINLNKEHKTHRFVFKSYGVSPMYIHVLNINTVTYQKEVEVGKCEIMTQKIVLMIVVNKDEVWTDGFYFDVIDLPLINFSQFSNVIDRNSKILPSCLQSNPNKQVSFLRRPSRKLS